MTEEEKLLEREKETAASVRLSGSGTSTQDTEYDNTMAALKRQESSLPEFSSSYDAEIQELYGKIVNRGGFKYSASSDPLYGVYRDRYTREGSLAMRDSMGQAAALTGGYGSSYAGTVGQQQYDAYLRKLSDALPELYSAAYQQYKGEGDRLAQQLDTAKGLASSEYGRYRDNVEDARSERSFEADEANRAFTREQTSFNSLMQLISATGYQPSEEELKKSGMSQAQAQALRETYLRVNGLLPSGGTAVSYSYYDAGGSASSSAKKTDEKLSKEQQKLAANAKGVSDTNKSRRK